MFLSCFLPAVELDSISQLGELVRQATLLDDALGADGHFTQRVVFGGCQEAEFIDGMRDHVLGSGVLTDDDVAALLVGLEHTDHLVWDV